jgi:hypothetical protein
MSNQVSIVSSLMPDSEQLEKNLRILRRLVRNGLPREQTNESPSKLQIEIQEVLDKLEPRRPRFSLFESLMYESLLAESHAMFGRIDDAIQVLEPAPGKGVALDLLNFLEASCEKGNAQLPATYLSSRKLLRQAIWLLMNYLFFRFYEKGSYDRCLRHLTQLETVVSRHLKTDKYTPYGTLSRLYYYRSHCYRGLRRFSDVESDLMRSQENANQRLKNKLETLQRKKHSIDEHRDFAIICTARILGFGFGWTELNRGRLTRAKRLLLSADTLLMPTGHQAMQQLVQFLLSIIERRLASPGTAEYVEAIQQIKKQREIYAAMKSRVGELRALQELSRAYLDWIDLLDWSPQQANFKKQRAALLIEAQNVGDQFRELSETSDSHWRCRYQFIDVRFTCQLDEARYTVKRKLDNLQALIRNGQPEFETAFQVLQGYVLNRLGQWTGAIDLLQGSLREIGNDPLLEAEVRLLLAESFAQTNDLVRAEEERTRWATLSQSVQNCYLRNLEVHVDRIIDDSKRPFHIDFAGDLDLKKNTKKLEKWLFRTAQKRHAAATDEDIGNLLRIPRSSVNRKRNKLGIG